MARSTRTYSLVTIQDGKLTVESNFDADELREKIASFVNVDFMVFVGDHVPATISRDPVVTIGAPKVRKARAKKTAPAMKTKKEAKPTNGAQPQTA